jgi:hypothetical protein
MASRKSRGWAPPLVDLYLMSGADEMVGSDTQSLLAEPNAAATAAPEPEK